MAHVGLNYTANEVEIVLHTNTKITKIIEQDYHGNEYVRHGGIIAGREIVLDTISFYDCQDKTFLRNYILMMLKDKGYNFSEVKIYLI